MFASADLEWMDYVAKKNLIKPDTRVSLLGNRLVLIAPKDFKINNVTIGQGFDLARLAGDGRIATGDVKAVPVGKYAKAALEKLGSWQAAEPKFAMAENVRAALTLVSRGEAVLGIVYETDAKVDKGVKIVGKFPEDFAPGHHLSGGADQGCEAAGGEVSRFHQIEHREDDLRDVWLHVPDPTDVVIALLQRRSVVSRRCGTPSSQTNRGPGSTAHHFVLRCARDTS